MFYPPIGAGFAVGSDTAEKAAEEIVVSAESLRSRILSAIQAANERGMTCDEIEHKMALRHQTASARIRELALSGYLRDSGIRRRTSSNRTATVWIAV